MKLQCPVESLPPAGKSRQHGYYITLRKVCRGQRIRIPLTVFLLPKIVRSSGEPSAINVSGAPETSAPATGAEQGVQGSPLPSRLLHGKGLTCYTFTFSERCAMLYIAQLPTEKKREKVKVCKERSRSYGTRHKLQGRRRNRCSEAR